MEALAGVRVMQVSCSDLKRAVVAGCPRQSCGWYFCDSCGWSPPGRCANCSCPPETTVPDNVLTDQQESEDPWRPFRSDYKSDGVALRETLATLPHTKKTARALASTLARKGSDLDLRAEYLKTRLSSQQATSEDVRSLAATLEAQIDNGPK